MSQRLWIVLFALVAAGALVLRLPQLDRRPMHTDESVHALKFQGLIDEGRYAYDPNEFHGPSLYYFTLPVVWLTQARSFVETTEFHYRLIPLLFGMALILILPWWKEGLGQAAILWSAVFTAISPALVYYSRYYIHELLLVFFTLVFVLAAWKYTQNPRLSWALAAGFSLGMAHATKETWVIAFGSLAGALGLQWAWSRWIEGIHPHWKQRLKLLHAIAGLSVAFLVAVVLFTSFFTHGAGPLDSIRTYLPWVTRAGGRTPHLQPWYFYFERLAWFHRSGGPIFTEGIVLCLAVAGFAGALTDQLPKGMNPSLVRFLGFHVFLLATGYSIITYKTPWCLLGFYEGILLLAGVGVAAIWHWCRPLALKTVFGIMLGLGCCHLIEQSYAANYVLSSDPKNPWVYAHTQPNFLVLIEKVQGVALCHSEGANCPVDVIVPDADYWPLPWYLRNLGNVRWWTTIPAQITSPVVVASIKVENELEPMIQGRYVPAGYYAQRPNAFLELYVELELWKEYLKTLPPPED